MQILEAGTFFGSHKNTFYLPGLIITDTVYTHKYVDWHYHENPYFTFLLEGSLFEANKKESYYCKPGSLLFHNWQDAHYNIRHTPYARGLHLELQKEWFERNGIVHLPAEGSRLLKSPSAQKIFYGLYKELSSGSSPCALTIESLVMQLWKKSLRHGHQNKKGSAPAWVRIVKDIIHSKFTENITLKYLSRRAGIHPVHLCAEFPRYFNATISSYILSLRIEKALTLLKNPGYTLTEISYLSGFSDQSHFIKQFKKVKNITPSVYRKML